MISFLVLTGLSRHRRCTTSAVEINFYNDVILPIFSETNAIKLSSTLKAKHEFVRSLTFLNHFVGRIKSFLVAQGLQGVCCAVADLEGGAWARAPPKFLLFF